MHKTRSTDSWTPRHAPLHGIRGGSQYSLFAAFEVFIYSSSNTVDYVGALQAEMYNRYINT